MEEDGSIDQKREKGCKVYVPVNATVLKIEGHLVPLEQATKEQQIQYKPVKSKASQGSIFGLEPF